MKPYWSILGYGLLLAAGILLLRNMEIHWLMLRPAWEIYSGGVALMFLLLGLWLAPRLNKPSVPANRSRDHLPHNEVLQDPMLNDKSGQYTLRDDHRHLHAADFGISERELEVLRGMADGLSNAEIAEKLFLSTHTVKSHAGRLFEKLDVKRRTQAIQKGKELGLI